MTSLRPPLYDRHARLGAKFSVFGGWEMPLEYSGVVTEHQAVRERVGVFDVSHLGELVVRGAGARAFIDRCLTNDLAKIGPGQAQYTLCCDSETGGTVDDLIVYLHADDHLVLVPNAANTATVEALLTEAAPAGITVTDRQRDHVVLAVQGTRSDEVLAAMGLPVAHPYMSFVEASYRGAPVVVCRTGYTGERGYELMAAAENAEQLWDGILDAGQAYDILPCGLGARDTLRTEMGYPLHGQDLTAEISPVQARVGWAIGWKKPEFWGRDALVAQKESGPRTVLRGIVAAGRGIPRPQMSVRLARDLPIGYVTSGTFSPTLRKGIGLALIDPQIAEGAEVSVDIRGRQEIFVITRPPFVQPEVGEE